MFLDELLQTQSLIQLAHQNQATVGSHSRSLEIDLQGSIERELKGLILFLTHGVCTSRAVSPHSNPHKHRWRHTPKGSLVEFKLEMRDKYKKRRHPARAPRLVASGLTGG
jgi:hypothetical protein